MNTTCFKSFILAAAATVAFAAVQGCSEGTTETTFLNLSRTAYTFPASGSDSIVICVESNMEWEMIKEAEWVTAYRTGEDSVVVKAYANTSEEIRTGQITFTAGNITQSVHLEQLQNSFTGLLIDFPLSDVRGGAMSPNGKFAAAVYSEIISGDDWAYYGIKVNMETGETEEIPVPTAPTGDPYIMIQAISDDGETLIYGNTMAAQYAAYRNNELVDLEIPEGYLEHPSLLAALSSDGSVIVGSIQVPGGGPHKPAKWTDGKLEILPSPEENAYGEPLINGVIVRGCSADGQILYGSEWDQHGLIYWIGNEMFYPGREYAQERSVIECYAEYYCISPNGRWIASTFADASPVRVDTKTHEVEFFDGYGCGITVTDDGLVFGCPTTMAVTSGCVFDFDNGTTYGISEYMQNVHGLDLSDNRIIQYRAPGGKAYLGYRNITGSRYQNFVLKTE